MPRGGARPGSGPKRKELPKSSAATPEARRRSSVIYEALMRPAREDDSYEIKWWRAATTRDPNLIWKLFEHAEGRAVHTVNHLHDKPIEMNVTLSLAESIQKARKRVGQ